ncbi:MAG: hypothetical protein IKK44_00185 [Clostridium sp.]|nr:hypothetical protein [Clostridium sp.]
MSSFQVLEGDEGIEAAIRRSLARQNGGAFSPGGGRPDLLVVSPEGAAMTWRLPASCRTVLLPGQAGTLLTGMHTASAVSYGTGSRDTLTLSSHRGPLWAALQREVVTLGGQVVERQEFPIAPSSRGGAMEALAVAGALLLLGVPPNALGPCS